MRTILLRLAVALGSALSLLLASATLSAEDAGSSPGTNIVSIFHDPRLEEAVRQQVFAKRGTHSPLTAADVAHVATINGNGRGITSLTGLEFCHELAAADLAGNQIVDLKPLSGLRQLQYLNLATNRIEDLAPLSTNVALQYLELSHNAIADFAALSGLTNLANLYLGHNHVRTLSPVTHFHRLVSLYLENNQIRSLDGLETISTLSSLSVSDNHVVDLSPLRGLRSPTFLFLENNDIQDLGPLHVALRNDMAGQKNFAPFVQIYLSGNPLSTASQELLAQGKTHGFRYHE